MKSLNTALSGKVAGFKESLLSFIYPAHCIHCQERVKSHQWLCSLCSTLIELSTEEVSFHQAKTVSSIGPALSFLSAKNGPLAGKIAKTMAAFMVLRLQKLNFYPIDYLCPSPEDPFNALLTEHLSTFLKIPMVKALKAEGFFSSEYRLKRGLRLSDKTLLIIGSTLPNIEHFSVLAEAGVEKMFFLSFV